MRPQTGRMSVAERLVVLAFVIWPIVAFGAAGYALANAVIGDAADTGTPVYGTSDRCVVVWRDGDRWLVDGDGHGFDSEGFPVVMPDDWDGAG